MSKRLLLLGASGLIGSELLTMARAEGWQLAAPSHAELDIGDREQVMAWVLQFSPDVILNAAGYTDVDGAESLPALNLLVNDQGAANLAFAAERSGAMLVHLSSDYVFDGASTQPYQEDALPHPINAYGRAKLAGEQAVAELCPHHLIVRTSWLFGGAGRHFVRSMLESAATRTHLRIVDDQFGGPTPVDELAGILLQMLEIAMSPDFSEWGIYHCTGRPALSWHQFAQTIFAELQGLGYKVPMVSPINSQDYGAPAKRPLNSCLDNRKIHRVFGVSSPEWLPAMQRFVSDWCASHPEFEKE